MNNKFLITGLALVAMSLCETLHAPKRVSPTRTTEDGGEEESRTTQTEVVSRFRANAKATTPNAQHARNQWKYGTAQISANRTSAAAAGKGGLDGLEAKQKARAAGDRVAVAHSAMRKSAQTAPSVQRTSAAIKYQAAVAQGQKNADAYVARGGDAGDFLAGRARPIQSLTPKSGDEEALGAAAEEGTQERPAPAYRSKQSEDSEDSSDASAFDQYAPTPGAPGSFAAY